MVIIGTLFLFNLKRYVAKNRKIPRYVERRNIIYEAIKTHDGLTRPELLKDPRNIHK